VEKERMMAGLLMGGIGTVFYVMLWLSMGVTKLWQWGLEWMQRIANR